MTCSLSALLISKRFSTAPPVLSTDESSLQSYGANRWRRVQYLCDQFWVRWRKEYLCSLIGRSKWLRASRNFVVDDVVLLVDKNQPRSVWVLGRVIEVLSSLDGVVRRVRVRVASGRVFERAYSSLVLIVPSRVSVA